MAGGSWTHKDLDVWRKALDVAECTHRITRAFPGEERLGLSIQMKRAAVFGHKGAWSNDCAEMSYCVRVTASVPARPAGSAESRISNLESPSG
jgi:hypothetical protein